MFCGLGLYSSTGWRNEAVGAEGVCPAAQRYGSSLESGGSIYTAPGVTGGFGASATWLEEISKIYFTFTKIQLKLQIHIFLEEGKTDTVVSHYLQQDAKAHVKKLGRKLTLIVSFKCSTTGPPWLKTLHISRQRVFVTRTKIFHHSFNLYLSNMSNINIYNTSCPHFKVKASHSFGVTRFFHCYSKSRRCLFFQGITEVIPETYVAALLQTHAWVNSRWL